MMNRRIGLLADKLTTTLTLRLAQVGVTPQDYTLAMADAERMETLLDIIYRCPAEGIELRCGSALTESQRHRPTEDEFFSKFFELGLRHAYPLEGMLRNERWFGAFVACLKQPRAADRISA